MSVTDRAWDDAPCGLLTLDEDGLIVDANSTFLAWVGRGAEEVLGEVRLSRLLSVGGRIYWETHLAPLLRVDGRIDEVALELLGTQGRLPVLMTGVVTGPADGGPAVVRAVLSGARERSRYERELLAARKAADRAAGRTRALQEVTAALSRASGVDGVVGALLATVEAVGGRAATCWLPDARAGLVAHAATGEAPDAAPRPAVPGTRAVLADGPRVLVPLRGQSSVQGVLSLVPRDDPAADPPDLDVLTAVGQQGGVALDRARLHDESAAVAHQLQQSLLAAEVPRDDRFLLTTVYRPGVTTLEVGGDWYDAFLVDPDTLAVVVGDVVGRGLGAASAMGQLRSAVRALAGPGVGPAGVVSALDRFVEQVDAAAMTTLVYGEVDLPSGRLRYSCAGHLPPLLVPAAGEPHLDWGGRSTPLGLVLPGMDRTEAELVLGRGDQLMLYTDGLVERRDRPLPDGLATLVATAGELHDFGPGALLDELTARLLQDARRHDDVCALLLSWAGADRGARAALP